MPTLYRQKGSPNWYFSHTSNGKRVRPSTGTADKKAAQEYADVYAARSWRQEKLGEQYISFAAACLKWVKEKNRGRSDLANVRCLREHIGDDTDIRSLDGGSLVEFLGDKTPATRRRYINTLAAICRFSGHDPKIKRPSAGQGRERWLTKKEWERLKCSLEQTAPHLLTIAEFAITTGLRASNILSLEWSQCDLRRRALWIHPEQSKSRKPIGIPLSNSACMILKKQRGQHDKWVFPYHPDGTPIGRVSNHGWKSARKAAGLDDITFHCLRHTFATWHVLNGTPLEVLKDLGGWADIKMVLRYAHMAESHIKQYANNAKAK